MLREVQSQDELGRGCAEMKVTLEIELGRLDAVRKLIYVASQPGDHLDLEAARARLYQLWSLASQADHYRDFPGLIEPLQEPTRGTQSQAQTLEQTPLATASNREQQTATAKL